MKTVNIFALLLLSSVFLYAQHTVNPDTISQHKDSTRKQLKQNEKVRIRLHSDSTGNEPKKSSLIDTSIQSKYGNLLNDDPEYNKRYPFLLNAIEVPGMLAITWSIDRYILNNDDSHISTTTWKYNLQKGWEWDNERFNVTFFGHPYSGSLAFNGSRSYGYNYILSTVFAVEGNLLWVYFGENTRPSYNDIINTSVNGAFLGEILYRLSSNILDDRTSGIERVIREIAAGIIDPNRGFNRILQGRTFRKTNKEVYQKEPTNISLYAGIHWINNKTEDVLGKETTSAIFNLQLDYGNPFEICSRKPFDFFKLRADFGFLVGNKYIDNVTGYGILFGKNKQLGKLSILIGGFQYYDYTDNNTFELSTIGFGSGVITKLPISKTSNLYTSVHLALVPFAGNSTQFGPDVSEVRDYNFGGGLEGKFECTFNFGEYATASLIYYVYMISTYVGEHGDNYIHILKPRITVQLYKNLSIGFENYIYYNERDLRDYPDLHSISTEQKLFLLLYLEDSQRRGHYN